LTELTAAEVKLQEEARVFAKNNKHEIAAKFTDRSIFVSETNPVAVFMAGSPGAGKTESSKELIAEIEAEEPRSRVLRIDPDDLRSQFPSYDGANSYLFQPAISILVARILDLAHEQRQSFLLDGTLSNIKVARENVGRCIRKKRPTQILYVYQDPIMAWQFVQAREAEEGRSIPIDRFVEQYYAARDVVNTLKSEFGADIMVDLLVKPYDGAERLYRAGIDKIDNHVMEKYDRAELVRLLQREEG
jgi:UDP-N-acetylglucosamine kinase